MKHQPFEAWLLAGEPLDPLRAKALLVHLQECRACRGLEAGLQRVETALKAVPLAVPQPGFASRFAVRFEHDRLRRRQAGGWRLLTGAMGLVAALIVAIGLAFFLTGGSLTFLFAEGVQAMVRCLLWARVAGEIVQTIVGSLPLVTASGIVLSFATLIAALGLTALAWAMSIRRFSTTGVLK